MHRFQHFLRELVSICALGDFWDFKLLSVSHISFNISKHLFRVEINSNDQPIVFLLVFVLIQVSGVIFRSHLFQSLWSSIKIPFFIDAPQSSQRLICPCTRSIWTIYYEKVHSNKYGTKKTYIFRREKGKHWKSWEKFCVKGQTNQKKNIVLSHFPSIVTSPLSTQELGVDILPSLSETALPMLTTYLWTSSVGFIFRFLSEC